MLFPRPASAPITVGPYTLTELIGQGGMAVVYKAKRQGPAGFEKTVVVKAMLPGLISRTELVDLFRAEAKLSAQLAHPNVVQVHDFGVAEGVPYLVMEYLNGRNLTQLRAAIEAQGGPGKLPIGAALAIARDMCHALGYAHDFVDNEGNRRQIIHRDVSPSNIMLCRDGMVKLLDFGVAKVAGQFEAEVTQSFRGKYAYMAPEQVNRQAIDCRVDVFAAGIVLHEMLTGKRLFAAPGELETLERVAQARVVAPSVDNPDVPRKLDALVKKALSKDPAARFSSGAEMAEAFDKLGQKAWSRRKLASWLSQLFPEAFTVTCDVCGKQVPPGDECPECGTFAPSHDTDVAPISMRSIPAIDSQPLPLPPPPDSGKVVKLSAVRAEVPEFDRPSTLESFCTLAPNTEIRSFDEQGPTDAVIADRVEAGSTAPSALPEFDAPSTITPLRPLPEVALPKETDYVEPATSPPPGARRLFVVPTKPRRDDDSVRMGLGATPPRSIPAIREPLPKMVGFDEPNDNITTRRPNPPLSHHTPAPDLRPRSGGWKLAFALLIFGGIAGLGAMALVARTPARDPLISATREPIVVKAPVVVAPSKPVQVAPVEIHAKAPEPPPPPPAPVEPEPVAAAPAKPVVVEPKPEKRPARVSHRPVRRAASPSRETSSPRGSVKDGRIVDPFAGMD